MLKETTRDDLDCMWTFYGMSEWTTTMQWYTSLDTRNPKNKYYWKEHGTVWLGKTEKGRWVTALRIPK